MTDHLTTERLREIACDPILLHYAKSDERLAMAAELLAKREECAMALDARNGAEAASRRQTNDIRALTRERDAALALLELVAGNLANFVAKREDAPASADAHLNEAMESLVAYQPKGGYSEAAKSLRLNLWREGPMRTLQDERDAARAEAEKLRKFAERNGKAATERFDLLVRCREALGISGDEPTLAQIGLVPGLVAGVVARLEQNDRDLRGKAEKLRAQRDELARAALELAGAADQVCPVFDARGEASKEWARALAPLIQGVRMIAQQPAERPEACEPRPWWVVFDLDRSVAANWHHLPRDRRERRINDAADEAATRGIHPTEIARALDEARAELLPEQPKPEVAP